MKKILVREAACKETGSLQVTETNSNTAIIEENYILFQNQDVGMAHMTSNTYKCRLFRGYEM